MKKITTYLIAVAAAVAVISGCKKDEITESSVPEIVSLEIEGETVVPGTDIVFNFSGSDASTPLSTLEVSAMLGTDVVATASIRTQGNEADLVGQTFHIPFAANMEDGAVIGIRFELINVDGGSANTTRQLSIDRPEIPAAIYMQSDGQTWPMAQDAENPYLYKTAADNGFENSMVATFATAEDLEQAEFIWGDSGESNVGAIVESGEAGINVQFAGMIVENYTFNVLTFEVGAEGERLDISVNGVALEPEGTLLYAKVPFTKDAEFRITGLEDIESCYNRDLFSYQDGVLTFLGESGEYDVYYSTDNNYFTVLKLGAVAPECWWLRGHGFVQSVQWNPDYDNIDSWETGDVTNTGYAAKISDNEYQITLYLSNTHIWGSFEIEIYSDMSGALDEIDKLEINSVEGDVIGIEVSPSNGLVSAETGFEPGYYRIVINSSDGTATFTRLSDYQGPQSSGAVLGGVPLTIEGDCWYGEIQFTEGEQVPFSGFDDMEDAYNRDFFSYENGTLTFLRESGTWNVRYYPECNYIWVYNYDLAAPDCLYILGNGKFSAPAWYNSFGASGDFFYSREVPYCCIAPSVGENKWQATMYLSSDNDYKDIGLEIYTDREWGKNYLLQENSISGPDSEGFVVRDPGLETSNINSPDALGYYRFTFTGQDGTLFVDIEKIAD